MDFITASVALAAACTVHLSPDWLYQDRDNPTAVNTRIAADKILGAKGYRVTGFNEAGRYVLEVSPHGSAVRAGCLTADMDIVRMTVRLTDTANGHSKTAAARSAGCYSRGDYTRVFAAERRAVERALHRMPSCADADRALKPPRTGD